ncbi:MAG: hypothetical protein IK130_09185, partial [Oscillospiraceae bacterium]|nr:hypothetical protein [Oscillospiraceae bacterium]
DYTVRIAAHSVFELCAVLPDTLEIDPIITPRLRFTDNDGFLLFDDYIAINWQAPDLARTEENDLLIAAKAIADVELLPQLMEFERNEKY